MSSKLFPCCLLAALPCHALEPLIAHIDIDARFDPQSNSWEWKLIADGVEKDPSMVFMPGRDVDWGTVSNRTGERHNRPGSEVWEFMGVGEGDPIWIYTQLNNQHAWLGFAGTQMGFNQPIRLSLTGVNGPANGHFSLFTTPGPVVSFATSDGITAADGFDKPDSHSHVNWAFSQKGMWRVQLTASAFLGPGASNPTPVSPEVALYFAIGNRAQWRASNFDSAAVMDESIAGDLADPDGDGFNNLLEYAFGGNPNIASARRDSGDGLLAPSLSVVPDSDSRFPEIRFHQRTELSQPGLIYQVEWSDTLEGGDWKADQSFPIETPVDDEWVVVAYRGETAVSPTSPRFARVRVTAE